jgi:hypothetical protein
MNVDAMVTADLALELAVANEQLVDVTLERDTYRAAWHVAVHEHHELLQEVERLRRRVVQLVDENRRLRGHEQEAA